MYCRIYLPCVSIKLNKRLDLVLTFCGFVMLIRVLLSRFLSHPFLLLLVLLYCISLPERQKSSRWALSAWRLAVTVTVGHWAYDCWNQLGP